MVIVQGDFLFRVTLVNTRILNMIDDKKLL